MVLRLKNFNCSCNMPEISPPDSSFAFCQICRDPMCEGCQSREEEPEPKDPHEELSKSFEPYY